MPTSFHRYSSTRVARHGAHRHGSGEYTLLVASIFYVKSCSGSNYYSCVPPPPYRNYRSLVWMQPGMVPPGMTPVSIETTLLLFWYLGCCTIHFMH